MRLRFAKFQPCNERFGQPRVGLSGGEYARAFGWIFRQQCQRNIDRTAKMGFRRRRAAPIQFQCAKIGKGIFQLRLPVVIVRIDFNQTLRLINSGMKIQDVGSELPFERKEILAKWLINSVVNKFSVSLDVAGTS